MPTPRFARCRHAVFLLSLPLLAYAAAEGVHAPAPDTLKKVRASATLAIGYHESTPPFTFISPDGTVMGYSHDIAMKIAEAVQRELKLPQLHIKNVPFTTQNRFPVVQNGIVDYSCGATTHTTEREKLVAFSNTIYVAGSRLMTRKDSGIKDFSDLAGKNVATFSASTSEKMLRAMNSEKNYRINIVSTFDRGDTPLSVLQAGQADAYMMDDVLLHYTLTQAWRPNEWVVLGTPQSFEAYACLLPRNDPAFKKVVDQEITRLMASGELEAIYRKWLLSPMPSKGVNLGMPMSEAMLHLLKNPNDKPFN